jgi:cupin fold WbuC family metalloprotein
LEIAQPTATDFRVYPEIQSLNFSTKARDLKEFLLKSNQGFVIFQLHQSSRFEETMIFCKNNTIIQSIKSPSLETSLFLIDGSCDVLIFSNQGHIKNSIKLDSNSNQQICFLRIPPNTTYSLIVHASDVLILIASAPEGNFTSTPDTKWAQLDTGSQEEMNLSRKIEEFQARIIQEEHSRIFQTNLIRESEKVLRLEGGPILNKANIDELIETLNQEELDRVRICVHESDDSYLQEMFIALAQKTFVVPSLHTDKNESVFIVEGLATVVFFDNFGNVTSRIPLAPFGNEVGRDTYCQILAGQIHSIVVESEFVLIKETTSGPFVPTSTYFPKWAPRFPTKEVIEEYNSAYLEVKPE